MRPVRQNCHVAAAVLHGGSGIAMLYFACVESSTWQPHVYAVQAEWVDAREGGACSSAADDWLCEVRAQLGRALPVNVYAILATFFFVSFAAEVAYALGKQQSWRWLEYAFSSALQFFAIEVLSNVLDLEAAVFGALLVASLQVYGYLIERQLDVHSEQAAQEQRLVPGKQVAKLPAVRGSRTDCHLWLALGFVQLLAAWVPVFYHFGRSDAPWWVWLIVLGSFATYGLFGVVMVLRVACGWTAERADYCFTALSLLSKLLVSWVYFGGTHMRKGHVTSST